MKPAIVQWDPEAYKEFTTLQQAVSSGKKTNNDPSYEQLLSSINNAVANLKINPFHGNLIPRKYLKKNIIDTYGADKIFRIELVGYWRLLYTVVGEETHIIAFILEYIDHKTYDKLFGYKKK